jgi:hypothetical protein
MRRLIDNANADLVAVLERLLAEDTDITIREVARRHPSLRNASAFTRNVGRMALIVKAQQRQIDARHVVTEPHVEKAASMAEQLERRNAEISHLETQVQALVASHAACIHAVMLSGGINALERFWSQYKAIGDSVRQLGAVPSRTQVIALPSKRK